ncbi:MAG: 7-cyano-7-deazaguanine synthase [Gammaproteobacteria bacterium]|nr:MAG: 7-cyano-7-deazaguanine synthase [Gammaproteobacteria bacterium]
MVNKKALVLFSGGLDSTTMLAMVKSDGYEITALTINYNQRHVSEIEFSKKSLSQLQINKQIIFDLDLSKIGGSALTDNIPVPIDSNDNIPTTYVPARNTIFLSLASSFAERLNISDIFIGANIIDYSGYPDCRPEFIKSFEKTINLGTKLGVEGSHFRIHTPLIKMTKAEIIKKGHSLGVDYSLTLSCYNPTDSGLACGKCDSCKFRKDGFKNAGLPDPTKYK